MTAPAFNLIDQPWIPVAWGEGESGPSEVGLRDLFLRARGIRALLIPEAPAHSALLRLLYALTARITGLDEAGPGSWGDRREDILEQGLPEQSIELPDGHQAGIEGYFDRWKHRFDLFGRDRPWLQDPRLPHQCDSSRTAGVNKLVMSRAAGQNHSWFGHWSSERLLPPCRSQAALALLTWHYWGAPGASSTRTVGSTSHHYAKAAPLRAALSYHPECDNLFLTLLAGLTPPDSAVSRATDLCPWERDDLPDPLKPMPEPQGPCSRLTACSQHALYLVPADDGERVADAYITWAYDATRLRPEDDYLIWEFDKDGNTYPRSARSVRSLWRDIDALLLKQLDDASPLQPKVMDHAFDVSEYLRVRALGFEQDATKSSNYQYLDAVTPALLTRVEEDAVSTERPVRQLRELGELFGGRLEYATKRAWLGYTDDKRNDPGAWLDAVAARYWPAAEKEFWSRFRQLTRVDGAGDPGFDFEATCRAFARHALDAYEVVTDSVTRTPRGAKAVTRARAIILAARKDPLKAMEQMRKQKS
ncbi:type I-E CRISPR-associated protein Cse1/CasA [Streptomyces chumphonensis]|uniref:Type I-E CRISPR-associated protein Cse1/CasA n=1 Tax=Streptomyces chumphonensis TaxID=1214925 RepID=A0A927IEM8_9ACTN|nr:type I-E CRISPR-associated protein Cse1/CasA [Streptomyces chumphonensis]MBD3933526.1 type I-E CRISPR-associated protein Cse1/CasA [Streptomyces chumphonensis]